MSRKKRHHDHYVVYCATNQVNGKKYIGQSCNFTDRKRQHLADAQNKHKGRKQHAFQAAIAKYGEENFVWEILGEYTNVDDSNIAEENFIKEYNSLSPKGYNLHPGGRNKTPNDETRKKISDTLKKVGTILSNKGPAHPNYGRVYTEEERRNQSEKLSGENGPIAKLTVELVRQIYLEALGGATATDLAEKYGMGKSTIGNILHRRSWKKDLEDLSKYTVKTLRFNSDLKDQDVLDILMIGYKSGLLIDPNKSIKYTKQQRSMIHNLAMQYGVRYMLIATLLRGRVKRATKQLYNRFIEEHKIVFS